MTSPPEQGPFSIETMAPVVIYKNTDQELIIVTRDKLQLCMQKMIDRMAARDRWMVPLGVLVPLILALVTTSFTERFKVSGVAWEAIFVMLILFTLCWLLRAVRQRGKAITVDAIVEELAKNPVNLGKSASVEVFDPEEAARITETPIALSGSCASPSETSSEDEGPRPPDYIQVAQPQLANNGTEGRDSSKDNQDQVGRSFLIAAASAILANSRSESGRQQTADEVSSGAGPEFLLKPGDVVFHDSYGQGVVLTVEGKPEDPEAKIKFDAGVKYLVLRYAPIHKTLSINAIQEAWPEILEAMKAKRKVAWILLSNGTPKSVDGGTLTIEFSREGEARGFSGSGYDQDLADVFRTMFGVVDLRINAVHAPKRTPGNEALR